MLTRRLHVACACTFALMHAPKAYFSLRAQVRLQLSYHPTSAHPQPYRAPAPVPPPAAGDAASPGASPRVSGLGPRAAPVAAPPVLGALAVLLQSTTLPSVKLAAPAALLQLGLQKHQAQLPAPSSGRCDWNFRCAFALQVGAPLPCLAAAGLELNEVKCFNFHCSS